MAYISSHSKGPEQDQLRSPFVPYVRNTAERSIHNFDSGPFVHPLTHPSVHPCIYLSLSAAGFSCCVDIFVEEEMGSRLASATFLWSAQDSFHAVITGFVLAGLFS